MISFVVPAHNEEELLPATLERLDQVARDIGRPYEIVVANDASTDRTGEIARRAGARVLDLDHRQIAATRNSGARAATGDVLFFIDADTLVTLDAVIGALDAMDKGAVGGGATIEFGEDVPLYGHVMLAAIVHGMKPLGMGGGAFLFCTRAAFDEVGGFDERFFASEEIWFCRALGKVGRVVMLDQVVQTSGRKFRDHTAREVLGMITKMTFGGMRVLTNRDKLDIWYKQRMDPDEE